MKNIDTLIADIRAELSTFDSLDQIDDLSLYRWASTELKRFGATICIDTDDVIEVRKGKAILPNNFYMLLKAVKCEPFAYECKLEDKSYLQNSHFWIERVERSNRWDSCEECCVEETENIITENIYYEHREMKFQYVKSEPLKLVGGPTPNDCLGDCASQFKCKSPFEIQISGNTLYANFDGSIYINYKGLPIDENGIPCLPETDLGRVAEYIENYLKYKIFETWYINGDEKDIVQKVQFLYQRYKSGFQEAMSDAKMTGYPFEMYEKMKLRNRIQTLNFEVPFLARR